MTAAERGDVEHAFVVEAQRADFLERRVQQDEGLAVGIDPQHLPGRLGADDQVAGLVEGERGRMGRLRFVERRARAVRRDLVDHAFVAGAGVQVAFGVDGQRPNVFVRGIEELGGVAVAIDLVDLAVGRCRHVQTAIGRRRERMRFELGRVEEH